MAMTAEARRRSKTEWERRKWLSLTESEKDARRAKARERLAARSVVEREKRRAYAREWIKAKRGRLTETEKERRRIYAKEYARRTNWNKSEKSRKYQREWAAKPENRDKRLRVAKRCRDRKPDLYKAIWHRRRARLESNGGSYTPQEWRDLVERCDHRCLKCGKREPEIKLTVDHIIPISKGGSNWITNIQPLCRSCNCRKRNKEQECLLPR